MTKALVLNEVSGLKSDVSLRQTAKLKRDEQLALYLWEGERRRAQGVRLIAGVDEVGRGSLAGPVYAAAVILDGDFRRWLGVTDSKQLSRVQREHTYERITSAALAWSVGVASVDEIDQYNILRASMLAMSRALQGLTVCPELALIDGPHAPSGSAGSTRLLPVVDGDAQCISIAAASIVAKVERDRYMDGLSGRYPDYGFEKHVGYATAEHLRALRLHGPCEHHRKTFAPVRRFLQSELEIE